MSRNECESARDIFWSNCGIVQIDDLSHAACGGTGEQTPGGASDSFSCSGESAAQASSAQRLAVAEPMLPPVVYGNLPEEADDVARSWEEFSSGSGAILWLSAAFFVALCLGSGWAVMW